MKKIVYCYKHGVSVSFLFSSKDVKKTTHARLHF